MPKADNPQARTIEPGIVQRVKEGFRSTGKNIIDWFAPMQPMAPVAPESVAGRQFDYPVGYNLQIRPRAYEAVTFEQMRALADNYTLLRLAIETRKDQTVKLKWNIKTKDEAKAKEKDSRIDDLTAFFLMPDKEHSWQQWYRMLLEDLFVIDAPTLYPRMTRGGGLYALELMDGATVKRVIDNSGRTPRPPEPAYQQILKGLPAVDYTMDELVYYPRNPRSNRIYGFSPVEQVIMIVNIGLRRDLSQLHYYTEGNIPDAFVNVPEDWTPDQIRVFQEYWDSILEGDSAQRRKAKFIPGKMAPTFTQDPKLKDEYDEWLARIICYCFSLPPLPFVKMQNRATSETQYETAKEEGLIPLMLWTADLINFIITKYFKILDLEFAWIQEEDIDPIAQAQIMDTKLKAGCISRNEIRKQDGLEPLENGDEILFYSATGIQREEDVFSDEEPVITATPTTPVKEIPAEALPVTEKIEKRNIKKKVFRVVDMNRTSAIKATRNLKKVYTKFFKKEAEGIAGQIAKLIEKFSKVDEDFIEKILREIDLNGWTVLIEPTEAELKRIYQEAGNHAIKNLTLANLPVGIATEHLTDLVNAEAASFARARAAEMVGKKWIKNKLVDNPNPEWAITESTRDMLRGIVSDAIDNGWSPKHLADEIEQTAIFSEDRAELIARTEIKNADNKGNMETYRATGLPLEKSWQVSADHPDEDECLIGSTMIRSGPVSSGVSRFYRGTLIKLHLSSGKELTGTPNHPVLTDMGWKPLKDIHQGDNLVSDDWMKGITVVTNYLDQMESSIENKVASFVRRTATVKCSSGDFHGDGIGSHVKTIATNGTLNNKIAMRTNKIIKSFLSERIKLSSFLPCNWDSLMSFSNSFFPSLRCAFAGIESGSFSTATQFKASPSQPCSHSRFCDTALFADLRARQLLREIKTGKILSGIFSKAISTITVSGVSNFTGNLHVYNLHTKDGLIIAENIITSNCDENEAEGWIDIDELFPSGDDSPGAHPRCMCTLGVRVKEQEE